MRVYWLDKACRFIQLYYYFDNYTRLLFKCRYRSLRVFWERDKIVPFYEFLFPLGAIFPGSAGRPGDAAREICDAGGFGLKSDEEETRAQTDGPSMGLQQFIGDRWRIRSIAVVLPAGLWSVVRSETSESFALQGLEIRHLRRWTESWINYTGLNESRKLFESFPIAMSIFGITLWVSVASQTATRVDLKN